MLLEKGLVLAGSGDFRPACRQRDGETERGKKEGENDEGWLVCYRTSGEYVERVKQERKYVRANRGSRG